MQLIQLGSSCLLSRYICSHFFNLLDTFRPFESLYTLSLQVVLAPVLLGALLNQYCNSLVEFVSPLMPLVAVGSVALLCGSAIAHNASAILSSGLQVVISVCCLHGSGFFFGYVLSRMLGIDVSSSRTISIEVGMQVIWLTLMISLCILFTATSLTSLFQHVEFSAWSSACWSAFCQSLDFSSLCRF